MTDSKNVFQRLHAVMEAMNGSPIHKDKKTGVPYMTLSHDKVTTAIRPLFIDHGIMPICSVVDHSQDGNLTTATVEVTFVNIDSPEDSVMVRAFGHGVDSQDKGPGKAISYAFKYALLKALMLETTDDPENDSINAKPKGESPETLAFREWWSKVKPLTAKLSMDGEQFKAILLDKYKTDNAKKLTAPQRLGILKILDEMTTEAP